MSIIESLADAASENSESTGIKVPVVPVGQAKTSRTALYVLPGSAWLWRAELSSGCVVLRHIFGAETIERPVRDWRDDLAFGRVRQVG